MKITIASRQSDLARIQAYKVADAIKKIRPNVDVVFNFSKSAGDKDLDTALTAFGDKGAFTSDFYQGLLSGEHDMVVHSWKDLPTEHRPGTLVAATLEREDVRDLVYFKKTVQDRKPKKLVVMSSSPRRAYNTEKFFLQYLPFQPEQVEFIPVRGNILTRLTKLKNSEQADAIIVAKAAMDRLLSCEVPELEAGRADLREVVKDFNWMVLPLSMNPAAAAQGALAIEVNESRKDLIDLLSEINQPSDFSDVELERKILSEHGGGCHQKIGVSVLTRPYGRVKYLRGLTEAGVTLNEFEHFELKKPHPQVSPEKQNIWPEDTSTATLFKRKEIELSSEQQNKIQSATVLKVARANGLPTNYIPKEGQKIWVSGLKSWLKLARRGLWVNGCDDGLGEKEPSDISALCLKPVQWVRLTHSKAEDLSTVPAVATYELVPDFSVEDLAGKKYFYWMSASSFSAAVEAIPEIKQAEHFCGPGHTFDQIKKLLGGTERLSVFLNYKMWRQWIETKGRKL